MILGFTGTRRGMTDAQKASVRVLLDRIRPATVHYGGAIGADADFVAIVASMRWEQVGETPWVIKHPCDIPHQQASGDLADEIVAAKAPLERNRDIVDASVGLIACPQGFVEEQRSGTWATIRYARRLSQRVIIVWPDGRTEG